MPYPMFSALWSVYLAGAHARETTGNNPYQDSYSEEWKAWELGWLNTDNGISREED